MRKSKYKYALVASMGALAIILTLIFAEKSEGKEAPEELSEIAGPEDPEMIIIEREVIRMNGAKAEKLPGGRRFHVERRMNEQETGDEEGHEGMEGGQEGAEEMRICAQELAAEGVQEEGAPEESILEMVPEVQAAAEISTEHLGELGVPAEDIDRAVVERSGGGRYMDNAENLKELLRESLEAAGIGWWWPYACAQVEAESGWNPNAENKNGLDKGLLQYRITFWDQPESIFDPEAQIRVYVSQVSARLAAGLGIEETISRHYTSDWVTEINWDYVRHVMSCLK